MIEIDHNPHEKRPTNGIWWAAWIGVALGWVGYLSFYEFDKIGVAIGFLTGALLAIWSLEMKGDNEPPSWMIKRSKPRVRR